MRRSSGSWRSTEERVVEYLEAHRTALGKELQEALGTETFHLWRACMLSPRVLLRRAGRRYLRLDRRVPGYARLSPSIQREFLTYTVAGLVEEEVETAVEEVERHIAETSRRKLSLARSIASEVLRALGEDRMCIIIGGDVPLGMAHSDPRQERSTGELVAGSDLDIVVILAEGAEELEEAVDELLFRIKLRLLAMPRKEELDYLVKTWSSAWAQLEFSSFRDMVACKVLREAAFLGGARELLDELREEMRRRSVVERLEELERRAEAYREECERLLLGVEAPEEELLLRTFTTAMEAEEVF